MKRRLASGAAPAVALLLAALLSLAPSCLNPRPDDYPSDVAPPEDPQPGSADPTAPGQAPGVSNPDLSPPPQGPEDGEPIAGGDEPGDSGADEPDAGADAAP